MTADRTRHNIIMENSALFDQIASKLKLKSDMTAVLVALEEYMSVFFSPKGKNSVEHVFDQLPPDIASLMKNAFLQIPTSPENQNSTRKSVDALTARLRKCGWVELTIAFQPDDNTVAAFSEWVKKNLTADTLIDLKFDKTIVGGALIVASGKYKDYSVKKTLAGRFQIQRDDIMDLLT